MIALINVGGNKKSNEQGDSMNIENIAEKITYLKQCELMV